MSIASDLIRGHTNTIILAQLLQEDSYGYKINKRIQELTQNEYELKEATLYTAFRRLEEAGYITDHTLMVDVPKEIPSVVTDKDLYGDQSKGYHRL